MYESSNQIHLLHPRRRMTRKVEGLPLAHAFVLNDIKTKKLLKCIKSNVSCALETCKTQVSDKARNKSDRIAVCVRKCLSEKSVSDFEIRVPCIHCSKGYETYYAEGRWILANYILKSRRTPRMILNRP